jgi:hypothetical protein
MRGSKRKLTETVNTVAPTIHVGVYGSEQLTFKWSTGVEFELALFYEVVVSGRFVVNFVELCVKRCMLGASLSA